MAEAGRVRMLAISSLKRSPAAPNLPTVAESGLPGFEMAAWHLIAAPRGTPAAIVRTLNEKIRAALRDPAVLQRYEKAGMESFSGTLQEAIAYLKTEQEKWRRVIRERNIKGE
jgi:tripartite-type tricarboxylate transporter receptor subunit TctC